MKDFKLTKYEREILDSLEKGEWQKVPNMKSELKRYRDIFAANQKDKMISIRVSSVDLESFKNKANETGIPYQTLITSLMKRFAEGKLRLDI